MRRLISIVTISLMIAAAAIVGFGWPGEIILLSLAPGLILGSVVAHVVDAWVGRCELRLPFVMLGSVLGIFSAMIAVLFIGAATVSDHVTIERTRWVPMPAEFVWESLEEPTSWGQWDAWLGRIEPVPSSDTDERRYTTTLLMGTTEVPAQHVVAEVVPNERFVWQIELAPGSAMVNVRERVELSVEKDGTRIAYGISYDLPNLTARALHAVLFARGLEATAEKALDALEAVLRERDKS